MTYVERLKRMEAAAVATAPREYITKDEYRRLKSNLTRAKNSGDGRKVLQTVEQAVEIFNQKIWPDDWAMWRIALEDAASEARYQHNDYDLAEELYAASLVLFRL